ncbi:MAG TPA: GNAT family N-acetyltransferase [Herpetosiphonaceae bacterium]|nr:GNAT family N-acetyltransferase [Herpetosiphonaceae bacterium]
MELRPAELDDLDACTTIACAVSSHHVWQLTLARDPAAALATSEYTMTLRCLRLPRQVVVELPGEPLEAVWDRAIAAFVACDDADIGGYVLLTPAEERPAATVARLVVVPELRRRGVGTALMRLAAGWAASEGLTGLNAHCSTRNHPAVAFFTRSGFTFTGYSESYYPRDEVALFWQRGV